MTSFETYFEKYYSQAIGYTCKKISNPQDAEDLVMETFYSCYNKFDAFDESKASFGTWFYVALNNRIKNYYRDTKSFDELDVNQASESSFEDEIAEAAELTSMREELAQALSQLNETQRKIVILKYFQDKNATEIAGELAMSSGNVRVQLNRAIQKIRVYFGDRQIVWEG
jgi:RNA polymerase sigma-70 factor (ECF subfamily)